MLIEGTNKKVKKLEKGDRIEARVYYSGKEEFFTLYFFKGGKNEPRGRILVKRNSQDNKFFFEGGPGLLIDIVHLLGELFEVEICLEEKVVKPKGDGYVPYYFLVE